jgi:hypothetical protein
MSKNLTNKDFLLQINFDYLFKLHSHKELQIIAKNLGELNISADVKTKKNLIKLIYQI